jgi:hypothetical protein
MLLPPTPTHVDILAVVNARVDLLFLDVASERNMPSGDLTPYHQAMLNNAVRGIEFVLGEWLEANDPRISHWGIEKGEDI